MWDWWSKVHYFIDFWHLFFWRLWRRERLLLTKSKGHKSNVHYSGFPNHPQKNLTWISLSLRANENINVCPCNELKHSMARANLNESKKVLTCTTTASKYIPMRPRICINWNPPFQTQIYLVKVCTSKCEHCKTRFITVFEYFMKWDVKGGTLLGSRSERLKDQALLLILWAVLEGCTNRAWPFQPISLFLKNCQNGTF